MNNKSTLERLRVEETDIIKQIVAFTERNDIEMVSIFMSILYSVKVLIAYEKLLEWEVST